MVFRQIFSSLKENNLLILLLAVFLVKQLFMVAVFPIFQGPDELLHYSTIQFSQEPKNKNYREYVEGAKKIAFSEEISKTEELTETDKISFHSGFIQSFAEDSKGKSEDEIKNTAWKKYIVEGYKPNVVSKLPGFYFISSLIEKILAQEDIFTRFFTERIFSALLGLLIVLLTYLIARKIGWDEKISLLLATLIAFQPMFSQSSAIINYDIMLIFTFTLFIYGAVWSLKDGLNWLNGIIMFLATALGIITKAPAIVLGLALFVLAIYFARKHLKIRNSYFIAGTIAFILLAIALLEFIAPGNYFNLLLRENKSHFDSIFQSLSKYFSTTLNRWDWSELSYWGNFGWLDTDIPSWIVGLTHWIEIASIAGLIAYFAFPQKIPAFLPQRKLAVFFLLIFLALQFAIRFADWNHFDKTGKIEIGTYGRYFLPVITAQFILISIGLGMLVRKYAIWKNILKVLSLSMILLWIYSLLIIIIPRYYL